MKSITLLSLAFVAFSGSLIIGLSARPDWNDNWENQPAAAKLSKTWSNILSTPQPGTWYSALTVLKLFFEDVTVTGTVYSDVMPSGRQKLIHSVGAIAQAKFVWSGHNYGYTGLFNQTFGSATYGLVRASSAAQPSGTHMAPGLSFKFFRDNVPSANFMAMYQLDGQESLNFFLNPLCNHVAARPDLPLSIKAIGKKFESASAWPGLLGLSDFAGFRQDGTAENTNTFRFPFGLVFQPNPALTQKFANNTNSDIPTLFPQSFIGNEVLYKIYAVPDVVTSPLEFLGVLQLSSPFVASQYADQQLFFRHHFIENDFKYRPSWQAVFEDYDQHRDQVEGVNLYKDMLPPWN